MSGKLIILSLSEFGCNINTRKFGAVKSLYSSDTTAVYSGGLVYEYSQEESKYGLVTISGSTVSELPDFTALKSAYANQPNPTGDGGYKKSGKASTCPAQSANWAVANDNLPAIPEPAKKYMTQGAGTGPGLLGLGSQTAGTPSTGGAQAGSGSVSGSPPKKAAAGTLRPSDLSLAHVISVGVMLIAGVAAL